MMGDHVYLLVFSILGRSCACCEVMTERPWGSSLHVLLAVRISIIAISTARGISIIVICVVPYALGIPCIALMKDTLTKRASVMLMVPSNCRFHDHIFPSSSSCCLVLEARGTDCREASGS